MTYRRNLINWDKGLTLRFWIQTGTDLEITGSFGESKESGNKLEDERVKNVS